MIVINTEGRNWLTRMMSLPFARVWGHYYVTASWLEGKADKNASNHFSTDGGRLFSYGHEVGYTDLDGRKVVRDCHFSKTTGKHLHAAKVAADLVIPCPGHN